jgi:hypothetical protein
VDGEWSFIETQRHLILATDCWLLRAIKGDPGPYHPFGLAGSWLSDPQSLGLDYQARPTLDEVVDVRRDHMTLVRETIAAVTPSELERVSTPPDTYGHPTEPHTVLHCLHVILDEEWEHDRYANRDLAILESR